MKRSKQPRLEDLIPNEELREKYKAALYSDKPLLGEEGGIFTELLQAMVNASLEGEMDHHMEQEKENAESVSQGNRRNGHIEKTVKSSIGNIEIKTPRDRSGTFTPQLIEKRQRELKGGLEASILALYAQGNSNEDIYRLIQKMYGIDYSTSAISRITDRVWPELLEWQQRPLKSCYAILYLDGIFLRVQEDGRYIDKTFYSVYGVDVEGNRDILALYLGQKESANEWLLLLEDLKRRGVEDIIFACIDGLPGFKKAIQEVFPHTIIQRCIVHKVRNSLRYISDKDYKAVCKDLRQVYTSIDRQQAAIALEKMETKWGHQGQRIAAIWRQDWEDLMAFMDYSEDLRRMIYTTNPVENLHRIMRKIIKSKGAWQSERALIKQIYLALMQNEKSWKRKAYKWKAIQEQLEYKFGDRFSKHLKQ
jgi:putative transposase